VDLTEVNSYKKKYNIWRETIKFFNTKVNQETSRREFFGKVGGWPARNLDPRDIYKTLLKKAGYVISSDRGKYYIPKIIPDVSLTLMKDFVNRESPIAWFKYADGDRKSVV